MDEYAMLSAWMYTPNDGRQLEKWRRKCCIRWTNNNDAMVYECGEDKRQLLVVRGAVTHAWSNAHVDGDAEMVESAQMGVRFHRGYLESANSLCQYLLRPGVISRDEGWTLDVTGHAMGGAVGVVAAGLLTKHGVRVGGVVTFGQPKVTDAAGALCMSAAISLTRVVGRGDAVADQPRGGGYVHFGTPVPLGTWAIGIGGPLSPRASARSTTKPHKQVADSIGETALTLYGNASSSHVTGKESHAVIEKARAVVAKGVGADAEDVVFTAGATESNNLILHSVLERAHWKGVVLTTKIEHPSIIQPLLHIRKVTKGAVKVVQLPVDREGFLRMDALEEAVRKWRGRIKLCAVIYANNEIGTVQNFAAIRRAVGKDVHIHADTTQVAGKAPIQGRRYMDSFTVSGHKIHGVKGVGALVVRGGIGDVKPMMFGGGQEHGVRPGTESPPLIASLAQAVSINASPKGRRDWKRVVRLTQDTRDGLERLGAVFNGPSDPELRMGNLISFAVPGTDGRGLVKHLSKHGICANVGSACSKAKRSRVLQAVGVPEEIEKGTVRIGLSVYTTRQDVDYLLKCLRALLINN
eukprot:jgi/Mesvir1/16597/Mv10132-RA.1